MSTAPTASGFGSSGGTSYSAPYAAGIAALYFAANGGRNSCNNGDVYRALQLTATPQVAAKGNSPLETLARQGAGLVQGYNAINNDVEISSSELLLNDTTYFDATKIFTLTNTGGGIKFLTLSHLPALAVYTRQQVS